MKKRLHTLLFTGFSLLAGQVLFGQEIPNRGCGSMEYQAMEEQADPSIKIVRAQIQEQVNNYIASQKNNPTPQAVISIPVVFHVVYKTAAQNVSDACIAQTLIALNNDFRKLNADFASKTPAAFQSAAADVEIQFCMASKDPSGAATTGITRTPTTAGPFALNNQVKYTSQGGKDIWDRNKYLNLWVCDMTAGYAGFAPLPGGPAATDGVMCSYKYLVAAGGCGTAPFDKGRTTVHEIGHWFGLLHIWGNGGCGSDNIADTPTQQTASSGCPTFPKVSCGNGPNGDMFMNYMDYTNDACMVMFTNGQKAAIQACLNGTRASLKTSAASNCAGGTSAAADAGIVTIFNPTGITCNTSFTPSVKLHNYGSVALTSCTINYRVDANSNQTYNWTGSLSPSVATTITLPPMTATVGTHTFTSFSSNPNSSTDSDASNDQNSVSFTLAGSAQNTPIVESMESAIFPPTGWTITNPDNLITWSRTTAAASSGTASMYMNNFTYNVNGRVDEITSPPLNLASATSAQLTFDLAYQLVTNPNSSPSYSDTLKVLISTNCGTTWVNAYERSGAALTTTNPTFSSAEFVPNSSQWRMETVNFTPYLPVSSMLVKFRHTCNYENNMYLDNINISSVVGLNEIDISNNVSVYPNPSSGQINVFVNGQTSGNIDVKIINMLGEVVAENSDNAQRKFSFDLSGQSNGMYFVKVETVNGSAIKKALLNK